MAAPTPTARGSPTGIWLKDGYSTKITFATFPALDLFEKSVAAPGIDGGEAIDQTHMLLLQWRVFRARSLKTLSPFSVKAAYDPVAYTTLNTLINQETTVTITFRDGSTLCFYGFLKTAKPDALEEGKQPELEMEIVPTNWDNINHVEAGPVMTAVAGT